ncbi:MAG: iron ABC transporter permease [Bacteroides sp.]|nr:iron ABC transporter permease [Bacteroides sp.]
MKLIFLTLATIILAFVNIYIGAVNFSFQEITSVLTGNSNDPSLRFIVLESRLPQAVTSLLAGAGLAACGLMLQTVFRNPLAGPSILGITSGSSLGVAIVLLLFSGSITFGFETIGGNLAVLSGALVGSFAIMTLLLILAERIKSNLTLLIVGMMTGYLSSSLVTLLSSISSARNIQSFVNWGMGTFSDVSLSQLPLFTTVVLIGLCLSLLMAKPLNLLLMGDFYAQSMGVKVKSVRRILLISTGLLSAIITSMCGPISFIGLAMPHVARLIMRTDDHFILMPATMLCGAVLALSVNVISVCHGGMVIPVNALTPVAGVPVVLYILIKRK